MCALLVVIAVLPILCVKSSGGGDYAMQTRQWCMYATTSVNVVALSLTFKDEDLLFLMGVFCRRLTKVGHTVRAFVSYPVGAYSWLAPVL